MPLIIDQDGWVKDARILLRPKPKFSHEPQVLKSIQAIVMHATDSRTAEGTLAGYDNTPKGDGAHFLVGKAGDTYQCVSLLRRCWHVGKIRSRCFEEHTCSPIENKFYADLLQKRHKPGMTMKEYFSNIDHHERTKSYPQRYPGNDNSIGIEVVGKALGDAEKSPWEKSTAEQTSVTRWLVPALLDALGLKRVDVYRHPLLSYKRANEAVDVTW